MSIYQTDNKLKIDHLFGDFSNFYDKTRFQFEVASGYSRKYALVLTTKSKETEEEE
jgi:hypothetical protein